MKKSKDTISLDVFRNSGKKGGTTTAKRGKEFYVQIGKKGSKIRWDKNKEIASLNSVDKDPSR